jgi:histidinol-phosphate aminotransferase
MSYERDNIRRMSGYVPGEQPKVEGLIKLNTNENPYPPSPLVLSALRAALDERLRLYPDPTGAALRERLAARYGLESERILLGNGCDDILNLCVRAFCGEHEKLAYFTPSYSLYPVLAAIQNAQTVEFPLNEDFQIEPHPVMLRQLDGVKLLFITQPNAPSGVWLQRVELQRVIEETPGVVVIDEAYVDFAGANCLDFACDYPNVFVARTFSKSFSLAGMRIGWVTGAPDLISALDKVRDSYNVNRLSQIAATAALEDWTHFENGTRLIKATRDRVAAALRQRGFDVCPSHTNFLFCKPPANLPAQTWFEELRRENVLIRWWDYERIRDRARVTIGTDAQMDQFLAVTDSILASARAH